MKPSIIEKLQQLSDRLEEVTHLLGQPEATSDMDNYRKLTREHAELTPVVEVFQNYQQAQSDLADAEEMLSDPEMKDFAAEEIEAAKAKIDTLDTELQKLLLPKDANNDKNIFKITINRQISLATKKHIERNNKRENDISNTDIHDREGNLHRFLPQSGTSGHSFPFSFFSAHLSLLPSTRCNRKILLP